jgi:hypothetical protein
MKLTLQFGQFAHTDLHGALNSTGLFLAAMPPSTVSGKVMSAQMKIMMTMVPKGRAAVDCVGQEQGEGHE